MWTFALNAAHPLQIVISVQEMDTANKMEKK